MDKICDGDARASPACNRRDFLDFDTVAGGPKNLCEVGLDSTSKDAVGLTARREILPVIRPGLSACVCVCERERERERDRQKERVSVCVCVSERERERESERVCVLCV
jgi:hypothetical protein